MLKNNIEFNVKVRYIETGITRAEFAQKIESTNSYANRIDKKKTVWSEGNIVMTYGKSIELFLVNGTADSLTI